MSGEISVNPRYQLLDSSSVSDDETRDQPPSYDDVADRNTANDRPTTSGYDPASAPQASLQPPKNGFVPPSYEAAVSLPTYEDVQKDKEEEARQRVIDTLFNLRSNEDESDELRVDGLTIGSDTLFFFAFIVAFFFNWIGLFIGYFVMFNLAGRYGSLSGFGASMLKWLMLLKYSGCCENYFLNQHVLTWGIFVSLACVIFLRGLFNWLSIRKLRNLTASEARRSYPQYVSLE